MSATSLSREAALEVLEKSDSSLMQVTQAVDALQQEDLRTLKVGVSSAVTVDLLHLYLRKYGLLNGARIEVVAGNFDDPIGDMDMFLQQGVDLIVLLPFFDSLLPSFEVQLEILDPSVIDAKEAELRHRYRLCFDKVRTVPAIYLGTFHRLGTSADVSGDDAVATSLARFNAALRQVAESYPNVRMLDTSEIVRTIGRQGSFDSRFYFRSKAPYTRAYMDELAGRIAASSRGFGRHFFKLLALDCDNTLWGGVIGEDLIDGIQLNRHDHPGNIFWRIQHEFSALERQGVLLALVTKNNEADVEEVLRRHPEMVLQESQIIVKKVNWDDKPSNLRSLAKELNIGLDSIVFLDDSSFECEAVRQQLPMVKTLQVPPVLSDYPVVVDQIKSLFLAGGVTASKGKTEQYRQRADAEKLKAKFETHEEYLASLGLHVELSRNSRASAGRISELSQKSNQFNLTTTRYSLVEVEQMIEAEHHAVYSLAVSDRFGNAGLTGVAVLRYEGRLAIVENFFMSCRVIGRGVETCIWGPILDDAVERGCTELSAKYVPSAKNAQVSDFYDRMGMPMTVESDDVRHYCIHSADFVAPSHPWIKLTYVE